MQQRKRGVALAVAFTIAIVVAYAYGYAAGAEDAESDVCGCIAHKLERLRAQRRAPRVEMERADG